MIGRGWWAGLAIAAAVAIGTAAAVPTGRELDREIYDPGDDAEDPTPRQLTEAEVWAELGRAAAAEREGGPR